MIRLLCKVHCSRYRLSAVKEGLDDVVAERHASGIKVKDVLACRGVKGALYALQVRRI